VPVKFVGKRLKNRRAVVALSFLGTLVALYLALCLRPHVRLAWNPLPFWLLSFLVAACLTAAEQGLARSLQLRMPTHWLVCVGIFNLVSILSQCRLWRSSSDSMYGVLMARSFLDGLVWFPNSFYVPGLHDISQSFAQWNFYWTPFMVWVPTVFLALFQNPFHGMQTMIHLCQLFGLFGWLLVADRLVPQAWIKTLFGCVLIAIAFQDEMSLYYSADIFVFVASPYALLFGLKVTGNFSKSPQEVPTGSIGWMAFWFGFLFVVKYSAVFTAIGYFLVGLAWAIPWKHVSAQRLKKAAVFSALFLVAPGLLLALNHLSGAGLAPSAAGENPADIFSPRARSLFIHVLLYPGYLLNRARMAIPNQEGLIIASSLALYVLAFAAWWKGRSRIPAMLLVFLLLPGIGLWVGSLTGNNFPMLIARYQYSYFAFPFLLLFVPYGFSHRILSVFPRVVGIAASLPLLWFLGGYMVESGMSRFELPWQKDPARLLTQSEVLSVKSVEILRWLSSRPQDSVMFVGFGDEDYQAHLYLRGRVVNLTDSGGLSAPVLPYYFKNGFTRPAIDAHVWRTSEKREIYLYSPYPAWLEVIKPKFPQVRKWDEVIHEPGLFVLKGTAVP